MAGLIIVFMLAMSQESYQYAVSAADIEPSEGAFFRIEGSVERFDPHSHSAQICDRMRCIPAVLPDHVVSRPQNRVIAEGRFRQNAFRVSKLLTRCDRGGHE